MKLKYLNIILPLCACLLGQTAFGQTTERVKRIRLKLKTIENRVSLKTPNYIISFDLKDMVERSKDSEISPETIFLDTLTLEKLAIQTEQLGGLNWGRFNLKLKLRKLMNDGLVTVYSIKGKTYVPRLSLSIKPADIFMGGTTYTFTENGCLVFEQIVPFTGCPSF